MLSSKTLNTLSNSLYKELNYEHSCDFVIDYINDHTKLFNNIYELYRSNFQQLNEVRISIYLF